MHLQIKVGRRTGEAIDGLDLKQLLADVLDGGYSLAGIMIFASDATVRLVPADKKKPTYDASISDNGDEADRLIAHLNGRNDYLAERVNTKLLKVPHAEGELMKALESYWAGLETILVLAGAPEHDHGEPGPDDEPPSTPQLVYISIGLRGAALATTTPGGPVS